MSAAIKNGGTAFPMQDQQAIHAHAMAASLGIEDADEREKAYILARAEAIGGLSVRDHFAGLALQGAVAGHLARYGHDSDYWPPADIADYAFEVADAMLAARTKGGAG